MTLTAEDARAIRIALVFGVPSPEPPEITEEAIERMARALYYARDPGVHEWSWGGSHERVRRNWRDAARASLEALFSETESE